MFASVAVWWVASSGLPRSTGPVFSGSEGPAVSSPSPSGGLEPSASSSSSSFLRFFLLLAGAFLLLMVMLLQGGVKEREFKNNKWIKTADQAVSDCLIISDKEEDHTLGR